MNFSMSRYCSKHKIFYSIIILNTINMMNNFYSFLKFPSKMFLHYITMFHNIFIFRRFSLFVWYKKQFISTIASIQFNRSIVFSSKIRISRISECYCSALIRTALNLFLPMFNWFSTNCTRSFWYFFPISKTLNSTKVPNQYLLRFNYFIAMKASMYHNWTIAH